MPYAFQSQHIHLPRQHDRRVKLTDADRERIKALHVTGDYSQYALAAKFGVSRSLIKFIVCPEAHERNKQRREERGGWKRYYRGGAEWASTVRRHRRRKQAILNAIERARPR